MTNKTNIVKSVKPELKQVLFIAMVPDEVDLHGDITSAEEIRKACHSYNKHCRSANLYHRVQTNKFDVVESYISEVDIELDGEQIKKSTWLVNLQVNDDDLWELIKSGEINGVSISALGCAEVLDTE